MLGGGGGGGGEQQQQGSVDTQQQEVPSQFLAAYPDLVPRLCLNRFYAAEGVRQAAHAVWRDVMGARGGSSLLSSNIGIVAAYYSDMTRSNSHMTAEAALQAIRELALRMPRNDVRKVLPLLLETLCACVQEESWPVRDAAVGSLGALLLTFASEIEGMDDVCSGGGDEDGSGSGSGSGGGVPIIPLMLRVCAKQLTDTIASVRDTAAVALAGLCDVQGSQHMRRLAQEAAVAHLIEHLDVSSSSSSSSAAGKKKGGGTKPQMSFLPPAMLAQPGAGGTTASSAAAAAGLGMNKGKAGSGWRKGGGWGCCLDCMEVREGSPEDAADGCLALLDELPASGCVVLPASAALIESVQRRHPQYTGLFSLAPASA
jgi:hypothetical protein